MPTITEFLLFLYWVGAGITFLLVLPRGSEPPVKWWMLFGKTAIWPGIAAFNIALLIWRTLSNDVDWRL